MNLAKSLKSIFFEEGILNFINRKNNKTFLDNRTLFTIKYKENDVKIFLNKKFGYVDQYIFDYGIYEKDIIDDRNYLQSVVWPYQTADGEIYDAKACMDIPLSGEKRSVSLDDVRNTAVEYNVGFMVGEFGIFGEHAGYIGRYRYTDETLFGYLQDMTTVFKENDLPWCYGAFLGNTGLVLTYPAVIGVKYDKTDSSVYYVDIGMRDFFQSTVQ